MHQDPGETEYVDVILCDSRPKPWLWIRSVVPHGEQICEHEALTTYSDYRRSGSEKKTHRRSIDQVKIIISLSG